MKSKRIAVLIIVPIIIALTVMTYFLVFNSQSWIENNNDPGNALTELASVVVVCLEVDIFISLIYFTSKKEKRKDIKTTVNKVALCAAVYSLAFNVIIQLFDLAEVPSTTISSYIFGILGIVSFLATLSIIVYRMVYFVTVVCYFVKDIKAKIVLRKAKIR